jgi:hypothetical protein
MLCDDDDRGESQSVYNDKVVLICQEFSEKCFAALWKRFKFKGQAELFKQEITGICLQKDQRGTNKFWDYVIFL